MKNVLLALLVTMTAISLNAQDSVRRVSPKPDPMPMRENQEPRRAMPRPDGPMMPMRPDSMRSMTRPPQMQMRPEHRNGFPFMGRNDTRFSRMECERLLWVISNELRSKANGNPREISIGQIYSAHLVQNMDYLCH